MKTNQIEEKWSLERNREFAEYLERAEFQVIGVKHKRLHEKLTTPPESVRMQFVLPKMNGAILTVSHWIPLGGDISGMEVIHSIFQNHIDAESSAFFGATSQEVSHD